MCNRKKLILIAHPLYLWSTNRNTLLQLHVAAAGLAEVGHGSIFADSDDGLFLTFPLHRREHDTDEIISFVSPQEKTPFSHHFRAENGRSVLGYGGVQDIRSGVRARKKYSCGRRS